MYFQNHILYLILYLDYKRKLILFINVNLSLYIIQFFLLLYDPALINIKHTNFKLWRLSNFILTYKLTQTISNINSSTSFILYFLNETYITTSHKTNVQYICMCIRTLQSLKCQCFKYKRFPLHQTVYLYCFNLFFIYLYINNLYNLFYIFILF